MNTEPELSADFATPAAMQSPTPSADFIHAISAFLDTDPSDLLLELGYYSREEAALESTGTAVAED